jgi:UDP-N-acetylglucosamine 2-epimerase (non-hydrolysing)
MKRIATFIGTRPEAIKMAPVIAALQSAPDLEPIVVNTGQHRELIDQVIERFEIAVDVDLAIMQPNQSLARLTSRLITSVDEVLAAHEPRMVLVQGDTTTVLATALASFYRHVPVGHVEAGLRTGNLQHPFPEEANRCLTTPLAALHFAPTKQAAANLRREHVPESRIFVTGNTVIDALQMELTRQQSPAVSEPLLAELTAEIGSGFPDQPFVLVTGHRRENFGDGFDQICTAIAALAEKFSDHQFIYPVHLNPRVHEVVHNRLAVVPNVRLIAPQPYGRTRVACKKKAPVWASRCS